MSFGSSLGLALLAVGFIALAVSPRGREMARVPRWLRVFAPNYRFFESPDADVELEFRLLGGSTEAAWRRAIPARSPGVISLFWAPQATLRLVSYQLIDELLSELAELGPLSVDAVQKLERFARLRRVLGIYHPELALGSAHFQLRIVQVEAGSKSAVDRSEVVLLESTELIGEA
jgi:hypothetical protein